jgi:peptidoglycan/xylan/chitin deacetylase (PgdA/CDA1 family)
MPEERFHRRRPEPPTVIGRRALLAAGGALAALAACTVRRERTSAQSSSTQRTVPPATTNARATTAPTHGRPAASTSPKMQAGGPAVEVGRGPSTRAEVALTFHGAGAPDLAEQILSALDTAGVSVTVMAVGTWLDAQPSLAKRFVARGHELGNHTWSHPTLNALDGQSVKAEIERCRDRLLELTGSAGKYFRQSGSQHSTPLIRELAGAAGYRACLSYDIDSLDWTDPGPDAVVANVRAATAGSIISLHLGHPGTVLALPRIITDLKSRGLHPVTATELLRA